MSKQILLNDGTYVTVTDQQANRLQNVTPDGGWKSVFDVVRMLSATAPAQSQKGGADITSSPESTATHLTPDEIREQEIREGERSAAAPKSGYTNGQIYEDLRYGRISAPDAHKRYVANGVPPAQATRLIMQHGDKLRAGDFAEANARYIAVYGGEPRPEGPGGGTGGPGASGPGTGGNTGGNTGGAGGSSAGSQGTGQGQAPTFTPGEGDNESTALTPGQLASQDSRGRGDLFASYLANQGVGDKTRLAQAAANTAFPGLNAAFLLNQISDPNAESDFGKAIGGGLQGLGAQGFARAFEAIKPLFDDPSGTGAFDTSRLTSQGQAAVDALRSEDGGVAKALITEALRANLNPFLRQFAPGVVENRVNQFRANDLETPLFDQFVRQGFVF